MFKTIIISSTLFGSIYLFSSSLYLLNYALINKLVIPFPLKIINTSVLLMTGTIITLTAKKTFEYLNK